ncbi:hypothetical protein ACLB2K_077609 [Fragaria x ananassa]
MTDLDWLYVYPKGIREVLLYIKEKYNNPNIFITENGYAYGYNASTPIEEARKDNLRIRYHHDHLWYLLKAIKDGVQVKGYYAWSFFDDFEWDAGYTIGFGLTLVDVKDNLKRYLQYSAYCRLPHFRNFFPPPSSLPLPSPPPPSSLPPALLPPSRSPPPPSPPPPSLPPSSLQSPVSASTLLPPSLPLPVSTTTSSLLPRSPGLEDDSQACEPSGDGAGGAPFIEAGGRPSFLEAAVASDPDGAPSLSLFLPESPLSPEKKSDVRPPFWPPPIPFDSHRLPLQGWAAAARHSTPEKEFLAGKRGCCVTGRSHRLQR